MVSEHVCEDCGRSVETPDGRDVHPCPPVVGERTARSIRSLHDPAQRFLDEF